MRMLTRVPGQVLLPATCGRGGSVGMSVVVGRTCVGVAVTTRGVEIIFGVSTVGVNVEIAVAVAVGGITFVTS
jgi:hypothetical protein